MQMDQSETEAFEETLNECKGLAKMHNVGISEIAAVRQLCALRYIANKISGMHHGTMSLMDTSPVKTTPPA